MCMYYALLAKKEALESIMAAKALAYQPAQVITASQRASIILNTNQKELVPARFGFPAQWKDDRGYERFLFNSRAETIAQKPAFRNLVKECRCLIPATSFYEWQETESGKQPFVFEYTKGLFAFAGIWNKFTNSKHESDIGFSIITTTPNKEVAQVHDRMPVILDPTQKSEWLERGSMEILKPLADGMLERKQVDRAIFRKGVKSPGKQETLA